MKSMLHSSMGTFKEIEDATITTEKISHLFYTVVYAVR